MAGIDPASAGAYAQYEAAKATGRSSRRPSLEWFSDRHKRRAAERDRRLAEARAARGPAGHEAVDAAREHIRTEASAAAEAARNGGERADIAR
ncbi:hypothetical protein [Methylobacterium indicum]|uniref:Uncharacterized protein n=1 Tax=Methylobacterium indicum TaxID=1775910 RepID=A0A8H8WZ50_9HYPH|nr:hypothetical protein [Methylobacterium indicum]BCM86857.1 hypothetical protein mvi_53180 [Methylobacterium indicum]